VQYFISGASHFLTIMEKEDSERGKEEEKTPEELLSIGEEHLAGGKFKEAIEIYKEIVKRDPILPTLAKACNDCGVAYAQLEQYEMAIGFFNTALNLSDYLMDEGLSACSNLALVYRTIGDKEKAGQYDKRAGLIREERRKREEEAKRVLSYEMS
jgi:tetratricopeptide (TPR) repeat protein